LINRLTSESAELSFKQLIYDGINAKRLPSYSRFDVSSNYNFTFSKEKHVRGKIGLSILNIFDNENLLNKGYSRDHSNDEINSIESRSIQRVMNVVFRLFR